jgi:hypothetical protein
MLKRMNLLGACSSPVGRSGTPSARATTLESLMPLKALKALRA